MNKTLSALLCVFSLTLNPAQASSTDNMLNDPQFLNDLQNVQQQWAKISYQFSEDQQEDAFANLNEKINAYTQVYPNDAAIWIWSGIVKSSYAKAKGGLSALSIIDNAKQNLEYALSLDKQALQGSALTSLAVLYHNVPGWPISFGSDKQAKHFFKQALEVNPSGIDANYFYAQYLYDNRQYQQAQQYLVSAVQAPSRQNRPLADEGRKIEIAALQKKLDRKLL